MFVLGGCIIFCCFFAYYLKLWFDELNKNGHFIQWNSNHRDSENLNCENLECSSILYFD